MRGSPSRAVRVVLFVGGAPFLWALLVGLRWAHLYRQRSGEGVAFASVAMAIVLGGGLLTFAALVWLAEARSMAAENRQMARLIAIAVLCLVVGGVVLAFWVEDQGDACIGQCGSWL